MSPSVCPAWFITNPQRQVSKRKVSCLSATPVTTQGYALHQAFAETWDLVMNELGPQGVPHLSADLSRLEAAPQEQTDNVRLQGCSRVGAPEN